MAQRDPVYVTKSYLPPLEDYSKYLKGIWERSYLTNQGPLLKQLESEIKEYTQSENFHLVTNGTIALQVALRSLGITEGEIITTPFTYVATISSIMWERCTPVFVDIRADTLCIDERKIESAITEKTRAIMPVHVFGVPCDVESIDAIAKKHNLKVIYDAAHAFGVKYKGRPLLSYGDISISSFHATKLFHTIEGGGIFVKDAEVNKRVELIKRFGHDGDEYYMLGINAKASEFQAAMGLCNLSNLSGIIADRKRISSIYDENLHEKYIVIKKNADLDYNFAYYPVILENEARLLQVLELLRDRNIFPRRYFHPSLNRLSYVEDRKECKVSEDVSSRIICLPLYVGLEENIVKEICEVINS